MISLASRYRERMHSAVLGCQARCFFSALWLFFAVASAGGLFGCDSLQEEDPVALPNKFIFAGAEHLTENADGSYTLTWQLAPYADAVYKVFEGSGVAAMDFLEPVAQTTEALYTTSDLRLAPRTCFVVRLFRKDRAVDQNKNALCTRPITSAFAGASSVARNASGSYTLSWEPLGVSGSVVYAVYDFDEQRGVGAEPLQEVSGVQVEVGPFPLGDRRCFVVRARLPGLPAFDENSRAVCTEDNVLSGFFGVEGAVSSRPGVVALNWQRDEHPDVVGYVVYEGTDFNRPVAQIDDPLVTSFEVTGLEPFARLTFGVRVKTRFGSQDSNRRTASARVLSAEALPFAGLAGLDLVNGRDAVLSWRPVEHALAYRVYKATAAIGSEPVFDFQSPEIEVDAGSGTTVTIYGLGDQLWHGFVVRSVSLFGVEDENAKVLSVETPDAGPPVFAGIRMARMEDGAARLNWDRPIGQVSSYRIYRTKGSGSSLDLSQTDIPLVDGSATSAVITGFKNGEDYSFLVRAVDAHGAEDQNINFVTLTAAAQRVPFFYGYISAQGIDEGSVRVRFNNAPVNAEQADADIASYQISVRKPGHSQWLQTVFVPQDLSKLVLDGIVNGLSAQTEYEFLVRSIDRWGNVSENELTIRGRTKDLSPPVFSGVRGIEQKPGASEIAVTWSASSSTDVDHYRVYYAQTSMDRYDIAMNKPLPQAVVVTDPIPASETQFVFPLLEKDKTYYFMVRAFDSWGNEDKNTIQTSYVVVNSYPSLGADSTAGATPELVPMAVIQLLASDPDTGDPLEYQQVSTTCDTSIAPFQLVVGAREGKRRAATLSWMPPQDYIDPGRSSKTCTVSFRAFDGQSHSPVLTISLQAFNRPPYQVSAVVPEPPGGYKRSSALTCVGDADDEDGNLPVFTYQWVKNGQSVSGATSDALSAGSIPLVPGDTLACEVTAYDGHDPISEMSATISFGNTPPENLQVQLSELGGTPPYLVGDSVRCQWSGTDVDGDAITFGAARLESSVNGVTWADAGLPSVACDQVVADRTCFLITPAAARRQLRCAVQGASDPYAQVAGSFYSSVATVLNASPVISSVALTHPGAKPDLGTVLTCQPSISDADGDALTLQPTYTWFRSGGVIVGATAPQYALTLADRGAPVSCTVFLPAGADGHGSAAFGPVTSNSVSYVNSEPTVVSVSLSPAAAVSGTTLTCSETLSDKDGDSLNTDPSFISYSWFANDGTVNGQISGASQKTYTVVPADRGKQITCRVLLRENIDGRGSLEVGPVASSNSVTPINTAPAVTSVTVSSNTNPAQTGSTLSCGFSYSDIDGDPLVAAVMYSWTINGVVISGQSSSTYTVKASDRGQELRCRVVLPPNADGRGSSATSPVAAAVPVVPENTPPEIDGVTITALVFPPDYVGASFDCSAQILRDFDSDPIEPVYSWYRDNVLISGATSRTYTAGAADRSTTLTCSISLPSGDGFDTTPLFEASEDFVSVGNRAPSNSFAPSLLIVSGAFELYRDDQVRCHVSAAAWPSPADADGDAVSITYVWTLNGSFFPGTTEAGTVSNVLELNGIPNPEDSIACRVRLSDGLVVAWTSFSGALAVTNRPPEFTSEIAITNPVIKVSTITDTITCSEPTVVDPDGGGVEVSYAFEVRRRGSSVFNAIRQEPGNQEFTSFPYRTVAGETGPTLYWNAGDTIYCLARAVDANGAAVELVSAMVTVQNEPPQGTFTCNGGQTEVVANPGLPFAPTSACTKSGITDADGDPTAFAFDTDPTHTTCSGLGTDIVLDEQSGVLSGRSPSSDCTVSVLVVDPSGDAARSSGVVQRHVFGFFVPFRLTYGESFVDSTCSVQVETVLEAAAVPAVSSSFQLSSLAGHPQSHTDPLTTFGVISAPVDPSQSGNLLVSWEVFADNPAYNTSIARTLVLEDSPSVGSAALVASMPGVQADAERDNTGLSAVGCSLAPCTGERASLAAGLDHTCVVVDGGRVFCFGGNDYGQLGLGFSGRPIPDVAHALEVDLGGNLATRLSAGGVRALSSAFTCAVVNGSLGPPTGGVMCWGSASLGQLGNGTMAPTTLGVPEFVSGLSGAGGDPEVVAVSLGQGHACALLKEEVQGLGGGVRCWGLNDKGQLGDGSQTNRLVPVPVQGFETSGALALAAGGSHTCVVTASNGVKCWGNNQYYQLAVPITNQSSPRELVPVSVSGLTNVTGLAAGLEHTCALMNNGDVKCWGQASQGQIGVANAGLFAEDPAPASGGVVSGAVAIGAGGNHTCAVLKSGAVQCWGANESGQLGIGVAGLSQLSPVSVANINNAGLALALGRDYTCVFLNTGVVKCFGSNSLKQLGLEQAQTSPVNASVPYPSATPEVPYAQYQDCRVFRAYEP